jgi:transposase
MGSGEDSSRRNEELEALRRENAQLRRENAELRAENGALRAELAQLKAQLAELQHQLEEAKRAQKRQTAPFSKGPPKENPKKPGRKPGAAYGVHAHRALPDQVDEVIRVALPERCQGCGSRRIKRWNEVVEQYQEEMPRKPIVRRFDLELGECLDCGRPVQGRHPLQTSDATGAAAAQVGPNAQAMVASLKDEMGVSHGKICKILKRALGMSLSPGGVAHIVRRVGERIEAAYRGIEVVVRRSRVADLDETGWKVGGVMQWLWTAVTRTTTLFKVRPSRGYDVVEEILGSKYRGVVGHDGLLSYDPLESQPQQQCWRHIAGRCEDLVEAAGGPHVARARLPQEILKLYEHALQVRDRRDAREISAHGLAVAVGRLYGRLYDLVVAPKSWRYESNRLLARHVGIHFDQMFTFLQHPGVEPTAWRVDQASRFAIANRKVFGGNRYDTGARALERICSVGATCVKRGLDFFSYVVRVLCAPEEKRDKLACRLLGLPTVAPG